MRVLRPDAHVYYAQALYRPEQATAEAYDAAQKVLGRVLLKRPGHREVRAMLGAIAKRRARLPGSPEKREADLRVALSCYRDDYERNLTRTTKASTSPPSALPWLSRTTTSKPVVTRARSFPRCALRATIALRDSPGDFWAAATLAECALHESLLGMDGRPGRRRLPRGRSAAAAGGQISTARCRSSTSSGPWDFLPTRWRRPGTR